MDGVTTTGEQVVGFVMGVAAERLRGAPVTMLSDAADVLADQLADRPDALAEACVLLELLQEQADTNDRMRQATFAWSVVSTAKEKVSRLRQMSETDRFSEHALRALDRPT